MKKLFITLLAMVVVWSWVGCITIPKTKPLCFEKPCYEKLTDTVTVAIDSEHHNYRVYHLRVTLKELKSYVKATGIYLASVFELVDGVEGAYGSPYKITVYKSQVWSWDEIEPKFIIAIKDMEEFIEKGEFDEIEEEKWPEIKEGV